MEKKYLKLIFFLLFAFSPLFSLAATLTVSPASGTYEVGQKFTVRVVATSAAPFNAVSLSLLFPSAIFSLDSVSKAGSLLTFWVKEPAISRSAGTISLEGVTPGGIKENTGTIVVATLHGTKVGTENVSFQSGQVLANDGKGTDITGAMIGAKFTIVEEKPKPATAPSPATTPIAVPVTVSEPEVPQPIPTLNAPEIMLGSKYGEQAIIGTSEYPKIQTLVTFLSLEGVKIFITGSTDEDGAFALVVPRSLKRGDYTVTARVIGDKGLNSKDSNAIIINVGNMFSDLGPEVKYALIFLPLVLLYLVIRIILHIRKDKKARLAIKKEVAEAENALHESLDILREEIVEHMEEAANTSDHKRIKGINKDLGDVEKIVKKEIKDIETE
jgi:hypothetical protein